MFLIEKERYYAKTPLPALPAAAGWRVPRRVPPLRALAGKPQPRGRAASGHPAGRLVRAGSMDEVRGDDSLEEVFLELEGTEAQA